MHRNHVIFAAVALIAFGSIAGVASAQEGPAITVTPDSGLSDGDTLVVEATGFPADSEEFLSGQCVTPIANPLAQCDVGNIVPVAVGADGTATIEITIKTGPIGDGVCGEGEVQCAIMVGSLTLPDFAFAPIFFGADSADSADDAATPEELALTGPSEMQVFAGIAFALIAVGGFMAFAAPRLMARRSS
jgi:Neocarzinostatin family